MKTAIKDGEEIPRQFENAELSGVDLSEEEEGGKYKLDFGVLQPEFSVPIQLPQSISSPQPRERLSPSQMPVRLTRLSP